MGKRLRVAVVGLGWVAAAWAAAPPRTIVAFGDSLTAGLGVAAGESYPADLARLRRSHVNAK